jgi:ABC-type amino acid transport substrate-binding protein
VMTVSKKKLINYVVITLLLTAGLIGATRWYFSIAVKNVYEKDRVIANMQSHVFPTPREVYKEIPKDLKPVDLSQPALQRIRESGVLRVGYNPESIPFSYFSEIGELMGLDVDMAQLLARELRVKLEFFPVNPDTMEAQLQAGQVDLVMSGVVVTTPRLEKMVFSDPYMEATLCFIVRDHRRNEFVTETAIKNIPKLKIGIPHADDYFFHKIKTYLPRAEIVEIKSIRDFFETNEHQLDALLMHAEGGSAWTLLYPKFQPVVPVPDVAKIPIAYPVAGRDREFANFLSQWIKLKKNGLEYPRLYNHWILGLDAVPKQPRWSIIRDVLKWVE